MKLSEEALENIAGAYHDAVEAARAARLARHKSAGSVHFLVAGVAPCEWIPAVVEAVEAELACLPGETEDE
jgi:hypothetical protein